MYSIDTSALIDAWGRDYRLSVFPSLWQRIVGLIEAGHLIASMTIRDELRRREDALAEWADGNAGLFVEDNEEIQAEVREILAGWPRQVNFARFLAGADPFVIALARCRDCTAVSSEKASGNPEAPRIPDACRHYGVRCIRAMDMFEELG
jgi:hypothetical protein